MLSVVFSSFFILVGFQNCAKVGVADAAGNQKLVGQGLVDPTTNVPQGDAQISDVPPVPQVDNQPAPVDDQPVVDPIRPVVDPVPPVAENPPPPPPPAPEVENDPAPVDPSACAPASSLVVKSPELGSVECNSDHGKLCVLICHRPPGNPEHSKTLMLPANSGAPAAHLRHGDILGACQSQAEEQVCESQVPNDDDSVAEQETEDHDSKDHGNCSHKGEHQKSPSKHEHRDDDDDDDLVAMK